MTDKTWLKLMVIGEKMGCHQMPERSFFYKGYQFPVCARCTGVIISAVVATLVFLKKKIPYGVCFAMASTMLIDWTIQKVGIKESTNGRRFVTGLVGGFGYMTLVLYLYRKIIKVFKDEKD